jgi:hypothetical protein
MNPSLSIPLLFHPNNSIVQSLGGPSLIKPHIVHSMVFLRSSPSCYLLGVCFANQVNIYKISPTTSQSTSSLWLSYIVPSAEEEISVICYDQQSNRLAFGGLSGYIYSSVLPSDPDSSPLTPQTLRGHFNEITALKISEAKELSC